MAAWILLKITLTRRGLEIRVRDSEGATLSPEERLQLPPGGRAKTGSYTKIGLDEPVIWIPRNWVLETGGGDKRACVALGTGGPAFRSLLPRFARELTLSLWKWERLGIALTRFRRSLAAAGNPMPFIFQAIGSTEFDLTFVEGK